MCTNINEITVSFLSMPEAAFRQNNYHTQSSFLFSFLFFSCPNQSCYASRRILTCLTVCLSFLWVFFFYCTKSVLAQILLTLGILWSCEVIEAGIIFNKKTRKLKIFIFNFTICLLGWHILSILSSFAYVMIKEPRKSAIFSCLIACCIELCL